MPRPERPWTLQSAQAAVVVLSGGRFQFFNLVHMTGAAEASRTPIVQCAQKH